MVESFYSMMNLMNFRDAKQLRTVCPTVDDLCAAMGTVSYGNIRT